MEKQQKRSTSEISEYFNGEVARFSDLKTGQASIMDARLMLDLLAETAQTLAPQATELLDIGCGAGNQTLNLLEVLPRLNCTLLDISPEMLKKAQDRVGSVTANNITLCENDIRTASLPENHFDIIVAAAVLHHLRDDADWKNVFAKIFRLLKRGGVLLVSDLICHRNPAVQALFYRRQSEFLHRQLGDTEAERILRSIAESDTPSPVEYQLQILREVGFSEAEILHKTCVFAAYYAVK